MRDYSIVRSLGIKNFFELNSDWCNKLEDYSVKLPGVHRVVYYQ